MSVCERPGCEAPAGQYFSKRGDVFRWLCRVHAEEWSRDLEPLALARESVTLRDFFAAMALISHRGNVGRAEEEDIVRVAWAAYEYADAMLKARKTTS